MEACGFKINPYKLCVENKMVGGKQLILCWHVDDIKISCVDGNEVSNIILWLESEYREMHGLRGKRHNYLGNVVGLFGARGSPNINRRLSEGSARSFTRTDNGVARDNGSNKHIQLQGGK